jgi:hypothetical protein
LGLKPGVLREAIRSAKSDDGDSAGGGVIEADFPFVERADATAFGGAMPFPPGVERGTRASGVGGCIVAMILLRSRTS